jgi:hypothetical protein
VITTFLVEHPWITTVTLVGMIVLGPLAAYWLIARPRLAGWLGLASILPVAALTLVPTSRDLAIGCAAEWDFPTLGAVELMANVVLFVPPVLLIGAAMRRPVLVLIGASIASGLIEFVQAYVTMLGRSCSTNDWLSNTLGAVLGAAIASLALRVRQSRTGSAPPC